MFCNYEHEFMYPITLPGGRVVYRLEPEEIDEIREALRLHRRIPAPSCHRLIPFGQGITQVGDRFECNFLGTKLGTFETQQEALRAWDTQERQERYSLEEEEKMTALDERYYNDLQYDEDGYKVFTPKPSVK
jgi:hypothetical protein